LGTDWVDTGDPEQVLKSTMVQQPRVQANPAKKRKRAQNFGYGGILYHGAEIIRPEDIEHARQQGNTANASAEQTTSVNSFILS
jgi:hypothetical protein